MTKTIPKPISAEAIYGENQKRKSIQIIKNIPTHIDIQKFSKWAEENRYYARGISEYPGPHDPETAPHMNEIMDRCHPDDPCTHIFLMKSVQSTATTTAESAMGANIKYKQWSMLYLTADQELAKIRSSANIDPMIDDSGLAQYIKPISERMTRKTADNTYYKEFAGGIKLALNSYGSIGAVKSNTYGFIICDEWDEAPYELKKQGDLMGMIEGRTMGLRRFKIIFISTPTTMETSRIYRGFMEGDQRYYFCPCPLCGEKQILILKGSKEEYGLTFTCEKDKQTGNKILIPETVRYICQYCKKEFHETKKQKMLLGGEWRPTVRPIDKKRTSYHVSGLLSPEMFLSWERICQEFINTDFGKDILKFKNFTINFLGRPWASVRKTASWEMLKARADDYCLGDIPAGEKININGHNIYAGPLLLYGGTDVHKDRLELCVTGFAVDGNKYIVDYQIFYGDTADLNNPCWIALDDYVRNHEYTVLGKQTYIEMCAIDAGYDPKADKRDEDYAGKAHTIYEFVSTRIDKYMAIMGNPEDNAIGILKESRIYGMKTSLTKRYLVSVSLLKEMIMNVIENTAGHNTIHVPAYQMIDGKEKNIPDEFYKQFLSERYQEDMKKPGTYKWVKIRNRNEVLDTFIYSIAAAEWHGVTRWTNDIWITYYLELIA